MKRFGILILVVLLAFAMIGCGKEHNAQNEDALYDLGIEVAKTMQEMVYSQEYISLYTSVEFEEEIVRFQATDYHAPIAVYEVDTPDTEDVLSKLGIGSADDYDKLSDNLKEQLDHRVSFSSIISAINAQSGTDAMALCSLLTATKRDKEIVLEESVVYLYVFEKGVPIAVTFTESGYANGQFVLLNDDVSEIFDCYSCKVKKIR